MLESTMLPDRSRDAPGQTPRDARVVVVQPSEATAAAASPMPMTIPGPAAAVADKVEKVSVEGRPTISDAKAGPGRIAWEMVFAAALVGLACIGIGAWFGWGAGIASLAVALVSLVFNPVFGASFMRMRDRSEVIRGESR